MFIECNSVWTVHMPVDARQSADAETPRDSSHKPLYAALYAMLSSVRRVMRQKTVEHLIISFWMQ